MSSRALGRAVVDLPAQLEQRLAALVLQHPPPAQRLEGERGVARVAVGQAEDPGVAVARAVGVARLELLDQGHVASVAGQVPCGGRPHGPAAHHDHLVVERLDHPASLPGRT